MKSKLIFLMGIVLILLSISSVCAEDVDNATIQVVDDFSSANYVTGQLGSDSGNGAGTFDDLQVEINNAPEGSVLNLTRDYNGAYGSRIQFNKDLTIDGQGHTLDCLNTECSAFYSSSGNITLMNLKIINGHNDDNAEGGAIHISGSAQYTIINCTFNNNWADNYGGAIYNGVNKPLTIINSTFKNNKADDDDGGAIYSNGILEIINCNFNANEAYVDGGAIYAQGDVYIKNTIFENNKAGGAIVSRCYGGAIRSLGDVKVDNSTFKNNYAKHYGGAIYANSVYINSTSSFIDNTAFYDDGGAIYAEDYVESADSIFSGNLAYVYGGAIYAKGDINLKNTIFKNNKIDGNDGYGNGNGGAIRSEANVKVDNSTFIYNEAFSSGGAIYAVYVDCVDSIFSGNLVEVDGGAIYAEGNVNLKNTTFENNTASGPYSEQCYGGAIRSEGDVKVDNSTFKNNHAYDYGGAIYADTVSWVNDLPSYFIGNYVEDNCGGAIYTNKFETDVKYGIFINNTVNADDDGGAIYINNENHETFSLCYFENNRCGDEGGAIYTDSKSSQLKLLNNIFINNDAGDKGDIVYNSGSYDAIGFNWYGVNNPSFDNKFKEYHTFGPDDDCSDTFPVHVKLLLDKDCEIGKEYNLTVYFEDAKGNPAVLLCDLIKISVGADNGAIISDWYNVTQCSYVTGITFANANVTHITANVNSQVLELDVNINTVVGSDVTKVFRNASKYYATFIDNEGKYLADGTVVQFYINGVMYDRMVSGGKGRAGLNINLQPGEYVITAINNVTGDKTVNNVTVLPNVVVNRAFTKYYRNASQYTVKILDGDANPVGAGEVVTFNVNGVFYNRTTDKDGIARLNINLHPGTYIITSEYKGCYVSSNIKVLSVLTASDLTKKYGTSDQFEAKLVDGQGKVYANQKIEFNINGVFYYRTTDNDGIVRLNINLQPGEYIITSSYNGAAIGNKVTVTV